MVEMGGPSYYQDEEEQPRRRQGRALGGFVIGLLLGLGVGFWAGRGQALELGAVPQDFGWALAAGIPLVILILVMSRFRERTSRESLPSSQARGMTLVLVGIVFTVGIALAFLLMMAR